MPIGSMQLDRRAAVSPLFEGADAGCNTTAALLTFNGALLQDVLEGTFSTDIGRAVFYGLSVQAKLVELCAAADLERRLAAIEERLAASQPQPRVRQWSG